MKGFEISWDTADLITKECLIAHLEVIEDMLSEPNKLHPHDLHRYTALKVYFKEVIEYFGGSV
jgi:hypothetical protein